MIADFVNYDRFDNYNFDSYNYSRFWLELSALKIAIIY